MNDLQQTLRDLHRRGAMSAPALVARAGRSGQEHSPSANIGACLITTQ
jgi:hypothetical protein